MRVFLGVLVIKGDEQRKILAQSESKCSALGSTANCGATAKSGGYGELANRRVAFALKRFASRRKIIGASFSEMGLREYLLFLSMYQTCRNKHLNFLGFLRAGGLDLDRFR